MKLNITFLVCLLTLFLTPSCNKKNQPDIFQFEKEEYFLKYDQTVNLLTHRDQQGIIWTNSNKQVGELTKLGTFIAKKIGSTKIKAKLGSDIIETKITVEPYITSISEPYTKFGVKKEDVKKNENKPIIIEDITGIIYQGNNGLIKEIYYIFYNNIYSSSMLIFNINKENDLEDLLTFYKERYSISEKLNGEWYFENQHSDYLVAIRNDPNYGYYALYHSIKLPK